LCETVLVLSRIKLGIMYVIRSFCKLHVIPQMLTELEFSGLIFEKYSDFKFHENPSCGNRIFPRGGTDLMELLSAFRNFANATKNQSLIAVHGDNRRFF
jgi:hypothetical protein